MRRFRLILVMLTLLSVMLLSWLGTTESGLNWLYRQVEYYLPLEISYSKVQGRLIGPITISDFEYRVEDTRIQADRLVIDWSPTALLTTEIKISQLHIKSLKIVLPDSVETETTPVSNQTIILPEISLPWRVVLKDTEIDGLFITQNDQTYHLSSLQLNASSLFSRINIKKLSIKADSFDLNIKGKLQPIRDYPFDLNVNWQTKLPSSTLINGSGQLSGDMKTSRVEQLIDGALKLNLDVTVNNLLKDITWLAKVDIKQFDLTKLDASWPALTGAMKLDGSGDLKTAKVNGHLAGNLTGKDLEVGKLDADFDIQRLLDNSIQINRLKLHAAKNDTHIDSRGLWKPAQKDGPESGNITLTMNWQNLRWPMQQETPWFNSANGSGSIEGNIDHYQFIVDSDSPWPLAEPSQWHASASGNLDGLKIDSLQIKALNGEANINGQVSWSPLLNWQAKGSVKNIDPASLLPEWPGQLHGKLTSKGRMQEDQLIIEAGITQLKGTLRNYPVSLNSDLVWTNDTLKISRLNFFSGKSQLQLDGQLGETLKLNWTVDSNDLAELYPEILGQLQAHGELSGPSDTPEIAATFKGKSLKYSDYQIAAIDGDIAVDLFHWQKINLKLNAQQLNINDIRLDSLDINASNQKIMANVTTKNIIANVELNGNSQSTGWSGVIDKAEIQSQQFDNWQLKSPARLSISETSLQLEKLCWSNNQQASLCSSLTRIDSQWLSTTDIKNFPLKLMQRWLPPDLKLESVANGTAKIEYNSADTLLSQIDIVLPAGIISYPMLDGENDQRNYKGGQLKLLLDAQGLTASSSLTMVNGDYFTGNLDLPGLNLLAADWPQQPLLANARIQANDLRLIETVIPEIQSLIGQLELKLTASGTLDKPELNASGNFINGSVQIPRLGLNIDQINLNSQSSSSQSSANKYSFRLDAHSGDGNISISGSTLLDSSAGWPTEIKISGTDFEVSRIPEARVQVSPDLQIKLVNRRIDIKGMVDVPYAKLQPKDISQAASVSDDAVIIGGEQLPEEKWLIHTEVRLTLGERVHFYGFGFEGRFGGNLLLQDEPGQLTKATGVITVPEGVYRAYGQRLEIENGRILYTGSPLTNPGLDLRAVRKVDTVTAGIHVKGSLSQPQLEIFSNPAMGQTDALAYIILGGPIENASNEDGAMMAKAALALGLSGGDQIARILGDRFGLDEMRIESSDKGDQAALVVGRYLSPKLYASYGVGLIDSANTLTLRYKISNKWQIKAESGNYQGADILYTFER